jgi:hypothetical protein
MIFESPEDIEKFLHLQALTFHQLKDMASSDIEETEENKEILIQKIIIGQNKQVTSQELKPQGLPLKSKDINGRSIPKAADSYKNWRTLIFQTANNLKDFQFVNKEGKDYLTKVYYIPCAVETARYIIEHNWYSKYESQEILIKEVKLNPHKFNFNIIRKNAGNGNNFLMLHCQLKENDNAIIQS